jgi:hypothetical protein
MPIFAAWGLVEWLIAGVGIGGATIAFKSVTGDIKSVQESTASFFKEVVIPSAVIYGAFIYLSSRKKS